MKRLLKTGRNLSSQSTWGKRVFGTGQVGHGRGRGDRLEQMSAEQATDIHVRTLMPEAQKYTVEGGRMCPSAHRAF